MVYPATISCSPEPVVCRVEWIAGTATLTMLTSIMAISWPVSTTASTTPGDVARPARRPLVRAGWRRAVVSVMPSSLPSVLCWYQEPGYPGTNTTWHGYFPQEKMGNVTLATINGSVGPADTDTDTASGGV